MRNALNGTRYLGLAAIAAIMSAFLGCGEDAPPPPPQRLVVLSPHPAAISNAFTVRFYAWYRERYNQTVTVQWISKGTTECHQYLAEMLEGAPASLPEERAIDVFFGGDVPVHADLARRGCLQPIPVSAETLAAIPRDLHGQTLYAEDKRWIGSALSGLGILYNRAAGEARGIPAPRTWADLALPVYANWIAAADPARSGSTNHCLILSLLQQGWDGGWATLAGVLANTSGLLPASSQIGTNVAAGVSVVGFEPEFLGRMQIEGMPGVLDFVSPAGATGIAPDPISVPAGARHPALAARFVEFVLSPEGQALWALDAANGGPEGEPLYRYPIRPDIYEKYGDKLLVKGNPFKDPAELPVDPKLQEAYTLLVPRLVSAACGKNHLLLQQAWKKALAEGPESASLKLLKSPPFDQATALQHAAVCGQGEQKAAQLEAAWSAVFRERYQKVLGVAATRPGQ